MQPQPRSTSRATFRQHCSGLIAQPAISPPQNTPRSQPWKTICGSDEPDKEKACTVALSDGDELPFGGCAELETTTYYHQCNSAQTSSYDRQEFYCQGTEKPYIEDDPETVRCGVEWYYPFDSGEPVVFSSEHKYCLDCGEAIGVCSDDPDKGCVAHGMPPRGRKFTTTVAPETTLDANGEGEEEQRPDEDASLVEDSVDGDALDAVDSVVATPVPPEEDTVFDIVVPPEENTDFDIVVTPEENTVFDIVDIVDTADTVDTVDEANVATTTMTPPAEFEEEVVVEDEPPAEEVEPEIMPTQPAVEGVDSSAAPVEDSQSGAMHIGSALAETALVAAASMATCLVLL